MEIKKPVKSYNYGYVYEQEIICSMASRPEDRKQRKEAAKIALAEFCKENNFKIQLREAAMNYNALDKSATWVAYPVLFNERGDAVLTFDGKDSRYLEKIFPNWVSIRSELQTVTYSDGREDDPFVGLVENI